MADSSPLDIVHDHVLRLLGNEQAAVEATADVVMRAAGRRRDVGDTPTLRSLLRSAQARVASAERQLPGKDLADRLAGSGGRDSAAAVRALTVPDVRGASLLLLTTRLGIDIEDAAAVVGVRPAVARGALADARRQVEEALTDAGVHVDVPTALAHLPVVPAIDRLHDMLLVDTDRHGTPTPRWLAWLGTAAVAAATAGGVALALPRLAEQDLGPSAPVVVAEGVTDGPAAREIAADDGEASEEPVEELVVSKSTGDQSAAAGQESAPAPSDDASEDTTEPAPEEEPSEGAAPTDEDAPSDEEPSDEPSEEPTEDPIELPLP